MTFGFVFMVTSLIRAAGPWEMSQVTVPDKWMPAVVRLGELPKTKLEVVRTDGGVRVTNTGDRIAFMVNVQCFDDGGKRIVPVHYSENFFSLLPGEASEIVVEDLPQDVKLDGSAWNVNNVVNKRRAENE